MSDTTTFDPTAIEHEMRESMGDSDKAFDEAGSRTGPWPATGESRSIFLGFVHEKCPFTIGRGKTARELPGYSLQPLYHSLSGHAQPMQWRGAVAYFPKDMDNVMPTLPRDSGRGNQAGLRAELGRIKNMAVQIAGETADSFAAQIASANAVAANSKVGVVLNVQEDVKTYDDGVTRTYRREYINSVFDGSGVEL